VIPGSLCEKEKAQLLSFSADASLNALGKKSVALAYDLPQCILFPVNEQTRIPITRGFERPTVLGLLLSSSGYQRKKIRQFYE
jgi:hypothetical protein